MKIEKPWISFRDRLPDCKCLLCKADVTFFILNYPNLHDMSAESFENNGFICWKPIEPPEFLPAWDWGNINLFNYYLQKGM